MRDLAVLRSAVPRVEVRNANYELKITNYGSRFTDHVSRLKPAITLGNPRQLQILF